MHRPLDDPPPPMDTEGSNSSTFSNHYILLLCTIVVSLCPLYTISLQRLLQIMKNILISLLYNIITFSFLDRLVFLHFLTYMMDFIHL